MYREQLINRTRYTAILWLLTFVLMVEAIGTYIFVSGYIDALQPYRQELPALTEAILSAYWLLWLLPLAALFLNLYSARLGIKPFVPVLVLLLLGLIWIPLVIYGIYLPFWEMLGLDIQ